MPCARRALHPPARAGIGLPNSRHRWSPRGCCRGCDGCPRDAAEFAGAVAVLGDRVELRHAAALAGLETGPATRAADALTAAGILARGRPIEFVHPTVRRAVYESLPPAERHRAHRQAAEILDAEGVPPDRIAAHLVVDRAPGRRAGCRGPARGGAAGAGAGSSRGGRRVTCGARSRNHRNRACGPSCCTSSARSRPGSTSTRPYRCLAQALELAVDVRHRAEIALELARVMGTARDTRSALAVLDRAVAEVGDLDEALRVRLEAEYISVARRYPAPARRPRNGFTRWPTTPSRAAWPGACCWPTSPPTRLKRAVRHEATRLANAALREDHLLAGGETDVALMASSVLMSTDQLDAAWRAWNAEMDRARRTRVDHRVHLRSDRSGLPRLPLRAADGCRSRRQARRRRDTASTAST